MGFVRAVPQDRETRRGDSPEGWDMGGVGDRGGSKGGQLWAGNYWPRREAPQLQVLPGITSERRWQRFQREKQVFGEGQGFAH